MFKPIAQLVAEPLRHPLVQFLIVGALLGLALHWISGPTVRDDETTIEITSADIARMDAGWRGRWNRPPTAEELDGLIRAQVRERALHREAVAMGLARDDPQVRRVLVQKLERIVTDLVELSLAPTDQDLRNYFDENSENYRPSPLITFTQVFVDPDRRGDRTLKDADEFLTELKARDGVPADLDAFGDPFMLQQYYPKKERQRIAGLFGGEFADSLFDLSPGQWHGPVLSGYGTHLVYIETLTEFPLPSLDEVRERLTQDWVDLNRREITETYFADLLGKYEVTVEAAATEGP